jgi:hypothetical protein
MSKVFTKFPSSVSTNSANHTLMAITEMGH